MNRDDQAPSASNVDALVEFINTGYFDVDLSIPSIGYNVRLSPGDVRVTRLELRYTYSIVLRARQQTIKERLVLGFSLYQH
jgi:hypothetical protein